MNLAATISVNAGGAGSGCNPAAGKCGRKATGKYPNWEKKASDWAKIPEWLQQRGVQVEDGKVILYHVLPSDADRKDALKEGIIPAKSPIGMDREGGVNTFVKDRRKDSVYLWDTERGARIMQYTQDIKGLTGSKVVKVSIPLSSVENLRQDPTLEGSAVMMKGTVPSSWLAPVELRPYVPGLEPFGNN